MRQPPPVLLQLSEPSGAASGGSPSESVSLTAVNAVFAALREHCGAEHVGGRHADVWGTPLPAGRARGVAVHESFDTVVSHVVEVSLKADGQPKVERVVVAVDCGTAVNPDVIRAQMEGGCGFGLSAALYSEISIDAGHVKQSNFHDYRTLRIEDMPKVEV